MKVVQKRKDNWTGYNIMIYFTHKESVRLVVGRKNGVIGTKVR